MGYLELHANRELNGVSLCASSAIVFPLHVGFDFPVITEFVHSTKSDVLISFLGAGDVIIQFLVTEERSQCVITVSNVIGYL